VFGRVYTWSCAKNIRFSGPDGRNSFQKAKIGPSFLQNAMQNEKPFLGEFTFTKARLG
jgi:hypothetical protein